MPIPKFYVTQDYDYEKQSPIHNVVDGQQRLRTLYDFLTNSFTIKIDGKEYEFKDLETEKKQCITKCVLDGHFLTDYSPHDITFLYDRLNRTGIKLTNMELWKAKYRETAILQMVESIYGEHKKYYEDILYTQDNIIRYLPTDDIIDICHSIKKGVVSGGSKSDLDSFLEVKDISTQQANQIKRQFRKAMNVMKEIFPKEELKSTLFSRRTHFISLFMAILFLGGDYYLVGQVDQLRQELKYFIINQPKEYKEIVTGGIRHKVLRDKRVKILSEILKKRATQLDKKRHFDPSLKMKLWHLPGGHECQICHKSIRKYDQATVDHKIPWAKGGKTDEANAQIAHIDCNRKKRDAFEKYIVD